MFTNEKILTEMKKLVARKGEEHTGEGRYMDQSGRGACFLGALCEQMGLAIPAEGTSAAAIFGGLNSREMSAALRVAQTLNDHGYEWKYVLMGVEETLAAIESAAPPCPCGCGSSSHTSKIIGKIQEIRRRDRALAEAQSALAPPLSKKDHALAV